MQPIVKKRLIAALVVALVWAAFTLSGGGDDSSVDADPGTAVVAEITEHGEPATAADEQAVTDPERSTPDPTTPDPTTPDPTTPDPTTPDPTTPDPTAAAAAPATQHSNLRPIAPAELPLEAIDTLDLIASGGPYPFSQDDAVFQNREGVLPDQPRGYYHEYTVVTPGEGDRGARRIVAGGDGELYYTDDHYDSFREIVLGS